MLTLLYERKYPKNTYQKKTDIRGLRPERINTRSVPGPGNVKAGSEPIWALEIRDKKENLGGIDQFIRAWGREKSENLDKDRKRGKNTALRTAMYA